MYQIIQIVIPMLLFMTLIWIISLIRKDASIVDRFWGILFIFLSVLYLKAEDAIHWRSGLIFSLVIIWGTRLSIHIHLRNRNHGEDIRYKRMRKEHKQAFWWYSYFSVFLFQGFLATVISLPLYFSFSVENTGPISVFDIAGLLFWLTGFIFEAGGDWQLNQFKKNPANKGKLLTTGFWAQCRHPNYFGDACLWWGYFLFALNTEWGWLTIISPIIMSYFLRYVSGVTLLERDLKKSKPNYKDYISNTPAFIPKFIHPKRKES